MFTDCARMLMFVYNRDAGDDEINSHLPKMHAYQRMRDALEQKIPGSQNGSPPGNRGLCCPKLLLGNEQSFSTTRRSLSAHTVGIPWHKIPETLKYAMHSTLELGVKFIWIDALCIVQDDEADWKEQASQMGMVYGNALLTLSATASYGIQHGCFSARQSQVYYKLGNHLSSLDGVDAYARKACEDIHSALFERMDDFTDAQGMTHFRLLLRGWAFQERLLSRRTLHCGPEELAWGVHQQSPMRV